MSYSFTTTQVQTFTLTSAKYIASKVAADLRRLNSYYGRPSESEIDGYFEELTQFLVLGYLESVEYGFKKEGARVASLLYHVRADGTLTDASPGAIYARADIAGASWFSYLTHNWKWQQLTATAQNNITQNLTLKRTGGEPPKDGSGYWDTIRSYSSDGVAVVRQVFRPY